MRWKGNCREVGVEVGLEGVVYRLSILRMLHEEPFISGSINERVCKVLGVKGDGQSALMATVKAELEEWNILQFKTIVLHLWCNSKLLM